MSQSAVSSTSAAAAPPDESTTGKHIPALDGFRGLALLLVFALHFFWGNGYSGHNPVLWLGAAVRNIGWVGVDLFFVLSGFLITGILYDTLGSPHYFRNFYARRALRILPLCYGYVLVMTLLNHLLGGRLDTKLLVELLTFTGNLRLPEGAGTTLAAGWITVNHLWSLAVEEQFYLVWPLLVVLLRTRRRIAMAAGCGVAVSLALRLILSANGVADKDPYLLLSFTPCRLDGLCMGAALAMAVRSRFRASVLRWSGPAFAVGCVALVVMGYFYPYLQPLIYRPAATWGLLLLALTFAALLAWTLKVRSAASRVLATPVMRFFGRYSYGLYLLHYSIAELSQGARPWLLQHFHSRVIAMVVPSVGGMAAAILVALLSFHVYEMRFLRLNRYFRAETSKPKLVEVVGAA